MAEEIIEVGSALEAAHDRMDVDAPPWFDAAERAELMRKRGRLEQEGEEDVEILERNPSFVLGVEDIRMLVADAVAGHRATEMVIGNVSRAWRRAIRARTQTRREPRGFRALCRDAAARGDLSVLQWLRANGCPWNRATCAAAAGGGHLAVLQWARANGCPWDKETVVMAARGGHIEVLEWMWTKKWPGGIREALIGAAETGQLEVAKWLTNKDQSALSPFVLARAAARGHFDVVKWGFEVYGVPLSALTYSHAVAAGHLEMVKWFHAHGEPFSFSCVKAAAENDRLEILKWADSELHYTYTHTEDSTVVPLAAGTGNLDLVQFLAGKGYALTSGQICSQAAASGSLETLKWAREENNCPWDERTCMEAARHGHLEILQWCRERGCPWDESTCSGAAGAGHLEVLQWAHAQGCPWDAYACNAAAFRGHLDVLKWLHANGCPWFERTAASAASGDQLEVLQWLRSEGCPWDEEVLSDGIGEARRWAMANIDRAISAEYYQDDDGDYSEVDDLGSDDD